jgi:hypothetical protein
VRRWVALLVTGMLFLTGACGSGSGGNAGNSGEARKETPLEAVLASASKTSEAKSSKLAMTTELRGSPLVPGGTLTTTAEGAFDYAAKQGSMVMTIPPIGGVNIGRIEAVVAGTTMYQKYPPQFAQAFGGKPWVRMDFAKLSEAAGVDITALMRGTSSDPSQSLHMLKGISPDVVEVGQERVRDAETTHYRGTIDPNRAVAAAPPEQQAAVRQLFDLYGQPMPVDVWIDGDDRVRRLASTADMSKFNLPAKTTGGQRLTGTMTITVELFDFGTAVRTEMPTPIWMPSGCDSSTVTATVRSGSSICTIGSQTTPVGSVVRSAPPIASSTKATNASR